MRKDDAANDLAAADAGILFVYDGECPLCRMGATLFRVRAIAGPITLVNARSETGHPVLQEIHRAGLDLDDGMVLKFQGTLHHGEKALELMAILASDEGLYNRINRALFRHPMLARIGYPPMRFVRNLLLKLRGVDKIRNLEG